MTDNSIFLDKKAAYYTLGCKLNFAETSAIGKSLLEQGVRTVGKGEKADICVINTCSVTSRADKECRATIRKAHREHPGAFIVVTGCYAQLSPDEIIEMEGVNLVLGSNQKLELVDHLSSLDNLDKEHSVVRMTETKDIDSFVPSSSSDERTRYFLKVQDGCDYNCSYCTIPKARGKSRNGTIASLVEQAKEIAKKGGKEIVLTGVNIGDFGRSTGDKFIDLIKELDEVEGIERFRISSIEPNLLKDEIIEFVANSKRFAPHFHMPIQSGSNDVLKLMRRRYTKELFEERVAHIRKVLPDSYIGVDVIVGTRGETAEFFEDSRAFLASIDFTELHIFSYSERAGTYALNIPYVVDPRDKHKRSQILHRLSMEHTLDFYNRFVGRELRVLWEEGNHDGLMYGHSDNYIKVAKPYDAELVGTFTIEVGKEVDKDNVLLLA